MSEPKLISPLLDGFIMGDPMSDKFGVRCCPAMNVETQDKYIVKIISVPPSQANIEALLLTGALKSREEAQNYYEEKVQSTVTEIDILQQLSRQEGFCGCEGYQVVPLEDEVGFEIYMLTRYRRSLLRQFTKKPLTHLDAVNMALDICSALTASRRAGQLYVNLRPSNVLLMENGEYRISDLGFVELSSLKYACLSDSQLSQYNPPEINDAFSSLNTTIDVYQLGRILYEVYNGGILPELTDEELPAPIYADEEMAQIILKACHPDATSRWEDPAQMGQAIVSYMQCNGVEDSPIVPPAPEIPEEPVPVEATSQEPMETEENPEESATEEPEKEPDISYDEVSDEVSQILSQADELAALSVPEPVVAPEPVEITVPEPVSQEKPEEPEEAPESDQQISLEEYAQSLEENTDIDEEQVEESLPPKKNGASIAIGILAALAAAAVIFLFIRFYYIKPVKDLILEGSKDSLTVIVDSEIDSKLLSVACTDIYGKTVSVPVVDGKALLNGLQANTEYQLDLKISGLHMLTGKTEATYFTPQETNVVQFHAVNGNEPGSVIISFTVSGPDSENWSFVYTDGKEEKTAAFTQHIVTVTGLEADKVYTGRLVPEDDLFVTGTQEITFSSSQIVQASNLLISECIDGTLTAKWNAPADTEVEAWSVRCFNGDDYDKTITVSETTAQFTGLDHKDSFVVEVTAVGQSLSQRAELGENAITVSDLKANTDKAGVISLSWKSTAAPKDGWVVTYVMGSNEFQQTVSAESNKLTLTSAIPGVKYTFSVKAADGTATAGDVCVCTTPDAKDFYVNYAGNPVSRDNLRFFMCRRPSSGTWSYTQVTDSDYTTTFKTGTKISFVIFLNKTYDVSYEEVTAAFLITDQDGKIVGTCHNSRTWSQMWYKNYCELNIPSVPEAPGKYTVNVYFNGQLAAVQNFTITE